MYFSSKLWLKFFQNLLDWIRCQKTKKKKQYIRKLGCPFYFRLNKDKYITKSMDYNKLILVEKHFCFNSHDFLVFREMVNFSNTINHLVTQINNEISFKQHKKARFIIVAGVKESEKVFLFGVAG